MPPPKRRTIRMAQLYSILCAVDVREPQVRCDDGSFYSAPNPLANGWKQIHNHLSVGFSLVPGRDQ